MLETNEQLAAKRLTAEFDPAEASYQRIDANVGTFAVSLDDVRPFADGVRVTLKLGNLSSATFNGAKLSLSYNKRMPAQGAENYANEISTWFGSLKTQEQTISSALQPGRWNPVHVVLPAIEPKDFGYLSVSIETDQLSLY
jgi:hypothetical protein